MAESEEELKNLLRVKEESENTDLKLNIHPDSALHRGNQALCGRSFTHRCVSVGIMKIP